MGHRGHAPRSDARERQHTKQIIQSVQRKPHQTGTSIRIENGVFPFPFRSLSLPVLYTSAKGEGGISRPPGPPRQPFTRARTLQDTDPISLPIRNHPHACLPTDSVPPHNPVCRPLFPQRRGAWGFQGQRTGGGRGGGEQLRRARHRGWSCGDLPGAHAHLAALAAKAAHALLAPLGAHAALSLVGFCVVSDRSVFRVDQDHRPCVVTPPPPTDPTTPKN